MAQVERSTSSGGKRYLTSKAVVFDDVEAKNIIVGGKDNISGLIQVLDETGTLSVNIDKDGVTLSNGAELIGGSGVLTNLQFISSGNYGSYSKVGFVQYIDQGTLTSAVEYDDAYLDIYIPSNLVMTSAIITLTHTPIYWTDPVTPYGPVTGYSRKVRVYKVASGKGYRIDNYNGILNITQSDLTEISGALGVTEYTPSNTTLGTIEEKVGIDIKSSLSVGHNILVFQSSDTKPAVDSTNLAVKTGGMIATINIIGFTQ